MLNVLLILLLSVSHADFKITQNLTELQRKLVLKTLGLGTMSKNLSAPTALGSDNGVEIGIMTEIINTYKIKDLISNSQAERTLFYPKILIGKGLFDRTDIYLNFIPYTATLGLSEFGGMLRFNFYHVKDDPFVASIILHGNSANFNNQLTNRNVGTDINLGMDWGSFAIFSGVGWATSSGKFIGGTVGVTDTGFDESANVNSVHFSIATQVRYSVFNAALSLDHYVEPVYSLKLGFIF
jgi:hypothetical protein